MQKSCAMTHHAGRQSSGVEDDERNAHQRGIRLRPASQRHFAQTLAIRRRAAPGFKDDIAYFMPWPRRRIIMRVAGAMRGEIVAGRLPIVINAKRGADFVVSPSMSASTLSAMIRRRTMSMPRLSRVSRKKLYAIAALAPMTRSPAISSMLAGIIAHHYRICAFTLFYIAYHDKSRRSMMADRYRYVVSRVATIYLCYRRYGRRRDIN